MYVCIYICMYNIAKYYVSKEFPLQIPNLKPILIQLKVNIKTWI